MNSKALVPLKTLARVPSENGSPSDVADLVFDACGEPMIVIDRAHHIVRANRAAIDEFGPAVIGRNCVSICPYPRAIRDNCSSAEAFATGTPCSTKGCEASSVLGEIRTVQAYPLGQASSGPSHALMVVRSKIDREAIENRLLLHERLAAFGLLAAGIAHDVGNPLACISTALQLMATDGKPELNRQRLDDIQIQVERIGRCLSDLTEYARGSSQSEAFISVNSLIRQCLRLIEHHPRARAIEVSAELDHDVPGVLGNPDHLTGVFLNLLMNAMDAIPGSGHIQVSTRRLGEGLLAQVSDDGAGIEPALLDRIWEPFFTTKPQGKGTGLGLFLARRVVERGFRGRLRIESELGRGTCVTLELPQAEEPRACATES